jgi:hypothetical protein
VVFRYLGNLNVKSKALSTEWESTITIGIKLGIKLPRFASKWKLWGDK